jgi:hypothetical protein
MGGIIYQYVRYTSDIRLYTPYIKGTVVRMGRVIPPLLPYVFMAWCLIKHRDNFTFTLFICNNSVGETFYTMKHRAKEVLGQVSGT